MSGGCTGGDRVGDGGSGGCDGMAGSGDIEGRKTKAGGTALKNLIDNTLDPRGRGGGGGGGPGVRRRAETTWKEVGSLSKKRTRSRTPSMVTERSLRLSSSLSGKNSTTTQVDPEGETPHLGSRWEWHFLSSSQVETIGRVREKGGSVTTRADA